jgi:dolichol-phosphate mannosyltransferase
MDALVVIPTFNEADNLPSLVEAILALPGFRVLVVDDSSPDGTGQIADALAATGRVEVIHRTGPRGLGRSYVDGLARAVATGADVVCQMDADWSHDPKYLPALVAATQQYDVVIGSRYVQGISVVNWPLRRLALSLWANQYVRFVTGLPVRDCTSGFRCWRRAALERVDLARIRSDHYAFLVEVLYSAVRAGATAGEVPIVFVERRLGQSKLSSPIVLESVLAPWRIVLRHALRRRHDRGPGS